MNHGKCCYQGFQWEANPRGRETTLAARNIYVAGDGSGPAIMIIHDLYGWKFNNTRVLADHYAEEVQATVYIPDFFGGESLPLDVLKDQSKWPESGVFQFLGKQTKDLRWPEILESAKELRAKHQRLGVIGFCFGGWASFRLADKSLGVVTCISAAHPTGLTEDEISKVGVPVQILAPEHDPTFTPELKEFSLQTIPTLGVPFDYQYFPGIEHSFAIRGNPDDPAEKKGLTRAKSAAVNWFNQWLRDL